jgi:hypothetical protein
MTPPAAAAAPRTRTRPATAPARRRSGPARSTRARPRASAAGAASAPLALRIGGAVHGLAEHRLLERIIRGRAWIAILTAGLIGIVFMQVSMLRMNAGIGQAVETASTLERENAALRASISELSSGDHIEAVAARQGLILPTSTPRFLDAAHFDPARALRSISAPGSGVVSLSAAPGTPTGLTATQLAPTGVAPSPDTTSANTAPASTAPAATTTAPSTTAAAPTRSSSTPPPSTTTTASPPPAPAAATTASTTGGAAGAPAG